MQHINSRENKSVDYPPFLSFYSMASPTFLGGQHEYETPRVVATSTSLNGKNEDDLIQLIKTDMFSSGRRSSSFDPLGEAVLGIAAGGMSYSCCPTK